MAQFGRPTADTVNQGYETHAAGAVNLFLTVDESAQDNNDYVQSPITPTSDVIVWALSAVVDPSSSTGHAVNYSYGKNASGGDQIDQTVQLRQGYVNESSLGTLIATQTQTNVGVFPQAGVLSLSGAEADAITNYASLFIRIVTNKP